jgi:1,4-dihydroxy-6-naphthoate synthase
LKDKTIAIPGKYTTANLLLSIAFPEAQNRIEYLFSDIEQAVLSGEADCGLIIHENRFTYQDKNLIKLVDLGEFWQNKTALPIPLGGIVIKRSFDNKIKAAVNRIIQRSMTFAYENPASALPYIKANAQEMNPDVMRKHIDLYVNDYSFDLGSVGIKAVERLFAEAQKHASFSSAEGKLFIEPENR